MDKIVTITNGTGSVELINNNYTVTASVDGYNNASISPNTVNVVEGTNSYAFTVAANGTLTLHVTDDGTTTGNPIVGATFVRVDSTGVEYGTPITSNAEGDAVFNNVPFSATNAPIIYYKQTASDGDHEFDSTVQQTTLTQDTATVEVENPVGAVRTLTLTDANYQNLPIVAGSLTLSTD